MNFIQLINIKNNGVIKHNYLKTFSGGNLISANGLTDSDLTIKENILINGDVQVISSVDNLTFERNISRLDMIYDSESKYLELVSSPVIYGDPHYGNILTCSTGSWSGKLPITYTYQWLRNGTPINGETNSTYLTVFNDVGLNIKCNVTAHNPLGILSALSNVIIVIDIPPFVLIPPTLSSLDGPNYGCTILCNPGIYSGTQPINFTYKWYRDGVLIVGQTNQSYVSSFTDGDKLITCLVKATNSAGFIETLSNDYNVVIPKPILTISALSTDLQFGESTTITITSDIISPPGGYTIYLNHNSDLQFPYLYSFQNSVFMPEGHFSVTMPLTTHT